MASSPVDPLVAKTGQAYIYGNADPITYSDPSGLDPDTSAIIRGQVEDEGGCTYSSGLKCFTKGNNFDGAIAFVKASRGYRGPKPSSWDVRPTPVLSDAEAAAISTFIDSGTITLLPGAEAQPDDPVEAEI